MDPKFPMRNTTLCYLEQDNAYLMLHRVTKKNYNRYLPWPEGKKPHPILYALTANLLSFGIGLELNTHCTNTQIRLIGLVCLVLWYAGPWLCRKLRKVQNAQ